MLVVAALLEIASSVRQALALGTWSALAASRERPAVAPTASARFAVGGDGRVSLERDASVVMPDRSRAVVRIIAVEESRGDQPPVSLSKKSLSAATSFCSALKSPAMRS